MKAPKERIGLVMTGGGARGAYQAGVLKRVSEIRGIRDRQNPFQIIGGVSAGAVNGSAIAAGSDDFIRATKLLYRLWKSLSPSDIYRTDTVSLSKNAGLWLRDLSLGGIVGGGRAHGLLDASPLRELLRKNISGTWIQNNIDRGCLYALTVAATNYHNGKTFNFIQGAAGHPMWHKSRRVAVSGPITIDHIQASAAIPLVFQPVLVQTPYGRAYFGDGCLRFAQPLSPVIRLGATKILAIGVRHTPKDRLPAGQTLPTENPSQHDDHPSLAQVLGCALNAMFLDHLDADVEHLFRLNELVSLNHQSLIRNEVSEPMQPIQCVAISPSEDLGKLAALHASELPSMIRFFLNGLGSKSSPSHDLISYLLFSSNFTAEIMDLGYKDAADRIDEIEHLLLGDSKQAPKSESA